MIRIFVLAVAFVFPCFPFSLSFLPFAFPPLLGGTDGGASLSVLHSAQFCSAEDSRLFHRSHARSPHLSFCRLTVTFTFPSFCVVNFPSSLLCFCLFCLLFASHCWFSGLFRCPIVSRRPSLNHPCQSLPLSPSFVLCLCAFGWRPWNCVTTACLGSLS